MRRTTLLAGSALGLLVAGAAGAETLQDALVSAYLNNPTLAAQRAALRATDEGVPTAIAGWRPTVRLVGSAGRTDIDTERSRESVITPRTRKGEVTQNLFQGNRTVAGIDQAEASVKAGRATLAATENTVFLQAATAFVDVLRDQAVAELRRSDEQVLQKQLDATRDRFRVGEITRTDVAQAEARLARAISDRVQAEGNLVTSRATYHKLVGEAPRALQATTLPGDLPATQEEAIRLAVAESPSIVAAAFTEEAARHGVRVAEATLYPTLGFSADWTRTDDAAQTQSTTRPGFVQSSGFLFTLTVPLYQSGSEYSTIRQAKQTVSQRRLQVEEARRTTIEAVTRAWEQLGTTRAVIGSRSEQVRAAEFALEGVREEANVGSRTTLDVLNSEQELLDARVALVTSRRDENVANFNLRSAMGRLTVRHLGLSVAQYDPLRNYEEVRKSAFGAGAKD